MGILKENSDRKTAKKLLRWSYTTTTPPKQVKKYGRTGYESNLPIPISRVQQRAAGNLAEEYLLQHYSRNEKGKPIPQEAARTISEKLYELGDVNFSNEERSIKCLIALLQASENRLYQMIQNCPYKKMLISYDFNVTLRRTLSTVIAEKNPEKKYIRRDFINIWNEVTQEKKPNLTNNKTTLWAEKTNNSQAIKQDKGNQDQDNENEGIPFCIVS